MDTGVRFAAADGVQDDTQALAEALAAHQVVDLGGPENVYLVTGPLRLDHAAARTLTGCGATIRAGVAGLTLLDLTTGGHTVSGLVLAGFADGTGGTGVAVGAPGVRIRSCTVADFGGAGVRVAAGGERATVSRCSFQRCGHRPAPDDPALGAVVITGAKYATVAGNAIADSNGAIRLGSGPVGFTCRQNTITGTLGIAVSGGRSGLITSNTITGTSGDGIVSESCSALVIMANKVRGGDGISVRGGSLGVTIRANTVRDTTNGIHVATSAGVSSRGVVITGNTIVHPAQVGIRVEPAGGQIAGLLLAGNDVDISGTDGIGFTGGDTAQIRNNRVHRPGGHAIRLDTVSMIQVAGNTALDPGYLGEASDGVSVLGSDRVFVRDNVAYGGRHAVRLETSTNATVAGTRWRSTGPSGVRDLSESATLLENTVLTGTRIMPLGDSITDGMDRAIPGAYRPALRDRLITAGYSADFVGTRFNRAGNLGDPDHQGYEGKQITFLYDVVEPALRATLPHVVLLHIGTNDVSDLNAPVDSVATLGQQLGALLDRIHGILPDTDLFVARIIDRPAGNATVKERLAGYNALVTSNVTTRRDAGRRVHLVDMSTLLSSSTDYADGTHPNAQGYAKMAQVWFDALRTVPGALSPR